MLQLVMYASSACFGWLQIVAEDKILTLLQLSQTVRDKCFDKCITKPGSSLSGSEGSCISRCVDRYIEATGIISKALFSQR
uniref:Mitochondrial import inner membrane translocase subunit n=1 Tax=Solanum chacoense TaxID=4108 RepID=A0A0V0H269_SOLCH